MRIWGNHFRSTMTKRIEETLSLSVMNERLVVAAQKGNVEIVRDLLNKGADVNKKDAGHTALFAAQDAYVQVVRALLNKGYDMATALIMAAEKGHVAVIRELLNRGADGDPEVVRKLLKESADTPINDELIAAAMVRHVEIAHERLENAEAKRDSRKDAAALKIVTEVPTEESVAKVSLIAVVNREPEPMQERFSEDAGSLEIDLHSVEVKSRSVEMVRTAFKPAAIPNAHDEVARAALKYAVVSGNMDVLSELLKQCMDVNMRDDEGLTPLMLAAKRGRVDIVKELLANGADIGVKDESGKTALIMATEKGHVEIVRELMNEETGEESENESPSTNDSEVDFVPAELNATVEDRAEDLVEMLAFAEESRKPCSQVTAQEKNKDDELGEAACDGDIDRVRILLYKGANVNTQNVDGFTALMRAARNGHAKVVRELLKKGAAVNTGNVIQWTALTYAAEQGCVDVVFDLLRQGATVNAQNVDGWTALMVAAEEGRADVVRVLLDSGADMDVRDGAGTTALLIAVRNGHSDIVRILQEARARKYCFSWSFPVLYGLAALFMVQL